MINVFVSMKVTQIVASVTGLLIPVTMVAVILILSKVRSVRVFMDRKIEALTGRLSGSASANKVLFIDQVGDGCIAQVTLNTVPDMLYEKTLGESGLRRTYNLLILLVEHRHTKPEPPLASTVFQSGDRLTVFGKYEEICRAFEAREYFTDTEEDRNASL